MVPLSTSKSDKYAAIPSLKQMILEYEFLYAFDPMPKRYNKFKKAHIPVWISCPCFLQEKAKERQLRDEMEKELIEKERLLSEVLSRQQEVKIEILH